MSERDETQRQQEKIDAVLRKNASTAHVAALPRTPLEELMALEEGLSEEVSAMRHEVRVETFRRMLEFFFQRGPDPLQVLRHVFALTKATSPGLIGDMSLEDIAIICADGGKATVSARIERIYNGTLEKQGYRATKAPFQKRSAKYREAQVGNTNRKLKRNK